MSIKYLKHAPIMGCLLVTMAFTFPTSHRIANINKPTMAENLSTCYIENTTFQPGEEITYKLFYNLGILWLSAGEVTFKVNDLGEQFKLTALGKTYKSYEWFYKVRDYYETHVNKETLLPNYSLRDINEGKYRLYDKITFKQNQQKAVSLRGKTKDEAKPTTYNIDPCMHDLLSIFYYMRNVDYNNIDKGDIIPIKIFIDKETWPLELEYRGRDAEKRIKGLGKFKTIKFGPEVIEGYYFKKGTEMNVWVSDDENKIPLLIESPVSVGSIKAVLKDYKNLRHDLTASLK